MKHKYYIHRNCGRRLYEIEIQGHQSADLHSYAERMREMRKDFDKLKHAKTEKEVDETLEKYEQFIEFTYSASVWTRKNFSP
jgi:hypothetical protein